MRKTVKGEIASQLFIYILGIIVVALLLLLGFQALNVIEKNKCTAQKTQFETDLAAATQTDKDWGIDKIEQFTLPCNAEEVCFVSKASVSASPPQIQYDTTDTALGDKIATAYGAINASVSSGDQTNVFIKMNGAFQGLERFSVPAPIALPLDDPVRCFTGSPLKIRFQGKGQTVQVADAGSD